jgi:hypothetical protein
MHACHAAMHSFNAQVRGGRDALRHRKLGILVPRAAGCNSNVASTRCLNPGVFRLYMYLPYTNTNDMRNKLWAALKGSMKFPRLAVQYI